MHSTSSLARKKQFSAATEFRRMESPAYKETRILLWKVVKGTLARRPPFLLDILWIISKQKKPFGNSTEKNSCFTRSCVPWSKTAANLLHTPEVSEIDFVSILVTFVEVIRAQYRALITAVWLCSYGGIDFDVQKKKKSFLISISTFQSVFGIESKNTDSLQLCLLCAQLTPSTLFYF